MTHLLATRSPGHGRFLCTCAMVLAAAVVASCAPPAADRDGDERLRVVTTTGILADLARNVVGDRATVVSIVPEDADPHSYEPSLRDVRDVVYADVAFSNYLLLEQQSVIRMLDANLPADVPNIALAESAVKYAARIIPLVENFALDAVWLGLRVAGRGADHGTTRSSQVELTITDVEGPGQLTAYVTETFGSPRIYVNSAAGFGSGGMVDSTVRLPVDAHTHMSWTFSEAGVYRLHLRAQLAVSTDAAPVPLGEGVVTFVVGTDPHSVSGMEGADILDSGHADITVDLDEGEIQVVSDSHHDGRSHQHVHDPATTVVAVPNHALAPVPASPEFRFLGRPGTDIYQLPQAVLGRHVHGEIDPHLWHDVRNAIAYVEIIRDTFIGVDPAGTDTYHTNADAYIDRLNDLDIEVAETIADIPPSRRHLITTHDAFGYLAEAYELRIAGFVTPNPATEPSLAERRRLAQTIRNLQVPAVFLEPNLARRSTVLGEVADQHGIQVCEIHGDAFTDDVSTYVELMRANARSLHRCLSPADTGAS